MLIFVDYGYQEIQSLQQDSCGGSPGHLGGDLSADHRAVGFVLGLRRIYRIIIQAGSGPSPREPGIPAFRAHIHPPGGRRPRGSAGKRYERALLGFHHILPLPYHSMVRAQAHQAPGGRKLQHGRSSCHIRQRPGRVTGLLLLRHLLVLGR